ncbi:GNAT family N-acetyltransferase [Micromonospora halophytica]|uniref:Acetyltransferase (GNAT) domain-containing protein n=1 Tax=Micromonospora halophytica TaxID=47864 RepID=A0A1C5ISF3_9ACTN|nr:GNAT family N-acetyltransferase [Micromonospora halophytica]SCG60919.1 Acetyltransferase (GNAT) domain-containing protein [Micromonospora halophytica]
MTVRILDIGDDGPSSHPDVYFTAGYGAAVAAADGGTWHLAYAPGRMMAPYLVRSISDDGYDAQTPYGYSGVHVEPGCPADELARCWSEAVARWRDSGLVSLFLRFSPLDPGSVAAVRAIGAVTTTRRADTVTVPVDQGAAVVWDGMAGRSRTAVRKARRVGLEATVRPAGADDLAPGSPFRRLYARTMARVGSSPAYLFPDRYYQLLLQGLGKSLLICQVHGPGGEVVAAALLMWHGERMHYHLAGSEPAAARDGANNLLLWTTLEWAADAGCARVHLGGGVRAADSLFRFKTSFGGVRTPFWTGSLVLDQARYDALVRRRAQRLGRPVTDLAASGFFPAYRWEAG